MIANLIALMMSSAQAASFSTAVSTEVKEIVSVFENSTKTIQYNYIENLGDGRGYTAGEAGFTTATGDLVLVAEDYVARTSQPEWTSLLPVLQKLAASGSGDISDLKTLPALWRQSAKDPKFRLSQDTIQDELYMAPARAALDQYNLKTPLAYLIFYDTMIQHGNGDDPDGFNAIVGRMKSQPKDEAGFLHEFLLAREQDLLNPYDKSSAEVWRESIDRVYALERLMNSKDWFLAPPFVLQVWDTTYSF